MAEKKEESLLGDMASTLSEESRRAVEQARIDEEILEEQQKVAMAKKQTRKRQAERRKKQEKEAEEKKTTARKQAQQVQQEKARKNKESREQADAARAESRKDKQEKRNAQRKDNTNSPSTAGSKTKNSANHIGDEENEEIASSQENKKRHYKKSDSPTTPHEKELEENELQEEAQRKRRADRIQEAEEEAERARKEAAEKAAKLGAGPMPEISVKEGKVSVPTQNILQSLRSNSLFPPTNAQKANPPLNLNFDNDQEKDNNPEEHINAPRDNVQESDDAPTEGFPELGGTEPRLPKNTGSQETPTGGQDHDNLGLGSTRRMKTGRGGNYTFPRRVRPGNKGGGVADPDTPSNMSGDTPQESAGAAANTAAANANKKGRKLNGSMLKKAANFLKKKGVASWIGVTAISLVILFLLIGIISFFINMPSMVRDKIDYMAKDMWKHIKGLVMGQDKASMEQVAGIADYIEKLGYDLQEYRIWNQYRTL